MIRTIDEIEENVGVHMLELIPPEAPIIFFRLDLLEWPITERSLNYVFMQRATLNFASLKK